MEEMFIKFLKDRQAYAAYARALKKERGMTPQEFFCISKPEDWADGAFIWSDAKGGDSYWSQICNDWEEIIHPELQ